MTPRDEMLRYNYNLGENTDPIIATHACVVDDGGLTGRPRTYLKYGYFMFVFSYDHSVACYLFCNFELNRTLFKKSQFYSFDADKQSSHGLLHSFLFLIL